MNYSLQMPGCVYSGENSLDHIEEIVWPYNRIAVLTDKGVSEAGLLKKILSRVEKANKDYVVIDNIPSEPAYSSVQETVNSFKESKAEFIIAVGGGSVMDTAKVTSVLCNESYDIKEFFEHQEGARKGVKTLMIPTTAGTGAETTPIAIVTFPEKELKMRIVNNDMMSDYVVLDPIMIKDLPRRIASSTGVDALCHAIECFTSKRANPFSDLFALNALDLILNNIIEACLNPNATEAKINMQMASFYAGVAITSASGNTAVHALSYPLGGKYHIPHGISNAMLLMPVMRFNERACRNKLSQAYDRCIHKDRICDTPEQKSAHILNKLEEIVKVLEIPTSLKEFRVPFDDLEILVKGGMEITSLLSNNMRPVAEQDARDIYRQIL